MVEDHQTSSNWQMEMLMEKLRSKACSFRSLSETSKNIKQCILNKQHILDPGEKTSLGKCLDKLQENIQVNSLSAMVERLEATAKQLGLQFTSGTSGPEFYISCDMFYVEVHLQNEGAVRDVKVELAGDQLKPRGHSSPELVECLSSGNFSEFMDHLDGFLSIYKLNTEKKNKCKAFQALQALENDLLKLFEMAQDTITDTHRLIFKSPVGLLINRKGGHPVRMIYFTSPYELLDVASQKSVSLTLESAASRDLSHVVSVRIEGGAAHKLQTTSLVNIIKGNDGLKLPSISGLNSTNSVSLPALFCLQLKSPLPVSVSLATKINEATGVSCFEDDSKQPLLPMIIQNVSKISIDDNNNKALFVTLPDQQHCYYLSSGPSELEGVSLSRVPFTHPTSVAHILEYLRAQALFNTLISSCVRPESSHDIDDAFTFEVCAVSHQFISVTFEHPDEESTATAEIDLSDISNVRCRLFTLGKDFAICTDEYATKVLQRCLSIPITMRAVIRKLTKEEKEAVIPQGDFVVKLENGFNSSAETTQNQKVLEYGSQNARRDHTFAANNFPGVATKAHPSISVGVTANVNTFTTNHVNLNTPVTCGSQVVSSVPPKNHYQSHFFPETRVKVRKKKPGVDLDSKSVRSIEESDSVVKKTNDSAAAVEASLHLRKDVKVEKVSNVSIKRRSSTEGLTSPGSNELAALREKVYGAGSAANFANISYLHSKDTKESQVPKIKKPKQEAMSGLETKKSPLLLDLTDNENARKPTSPSSALSAALLKRPGIEIIPIPGSNTPISIPSSITVTPVIKSSDDKNKEKKERKDKKELEKKEKKRRREDSPTNAANSPNSSGVLSSVAGKSSKIQILNTTPPKSTSISPLIDLKNEKSTPSVSLKPGISVQSNPKNTSVSHVLHQKPQVVTKGSLSPSHKSNKVSYTPTQTSISTSVSSAPVMSRISTSPKHGASPKNLNLSPKHSSLGKPSMNTLKSSPPFPKPTPLSPKLTKVNKEKGSPSRSSMSSLHITSTNISPTNQKPNILNEKGKSGFSDALTITKVPHSDSVSSAPQSPTSGSSQSSSTLLEKLCLDKAKASPPKNRKGSSLSDIVDKLRAGVSGSSDSLTVMDKKEKDKRDIAAKRDADNFMMKSNMGLKFTFNKSKNKDNSQQKIPSGTQNVSPSKNVSKPSSGLKPGSTSGPASKKPLSNLPPIPKLPVASSTGQNSAGSSPISSSMTSPLHYNRDRLVKDKPLPEKIKTSTKDSSNKNPPTESRNEAVMEKSSLPYSKFNNSGKEDHRKQSSTSSTVIDSVDRALKNIFGEQSDPLESRMNYPETDHKSSRVAPANNSFAAKTTNEPKASETNSSNSKSEFPVVTKESMPPPPSVPTSNKDVSAESQKPDETSKHDLGNHANAPSPTSEFSQSPSVSIKIVKSPVPVVTSPMNMISPQSISSQPSPCIIDDELMDEALMGPRK